MQSKQPAEWWKLEGDDLHQVVVSAAMDAQQNGGTGRTRDLIAWRDLYVDAPRDDWGALGLFRDRRTRNNVIQSAVDTVCAKLSKSRTRPWIVTANGDWKARYRAKLSTLWLDGQFDSLKIYDLGNAVLQDAAIFGDGVAKFYERHGKPACELVWAGDLFVDTREERFRCVRTMYQIAGYDKGVLCALYPKHADVIAKAPRYIDPLQVAPSTVGPADLVLVVEAWRLPDGPDTPGRHVCCAQGVTLGDEEWERENFPFERMQWSRDPLRYWGIGLVERMSGAQAELNVMTKMIEDAYHRCPPASIWVGAGGDVDIKAITNEPWKVYAYSGPQPPVMMTPSAIAGDFGMREEQVLQRAFDNSGVSQLSAQSQKPAGLNSGKAMLVYQDVESERFYSQAKALEQFYVGVARQLLAIADDIANDDSYSDDDKEKNLKAYGTPRQGRKELREVHYMDAMLGDMPHIVQVFPVSSLATSPQGRLQQISDLMAAGIISDPNAARELLDFPDLDRYNSEESAGRELVEQTIGEALSGEKVTAHPLMPLEYAIRKGTLEHDLAEMQGAPESHLQCLRDFIAMAETLMAQAAAPPPMPMPAPPGAAPMPVGPEMGGPVPPPMLPPEMGGMPPVPPGAMPPPQMGIAS
jgi:hypothetical protein